MPGEQIVETVLRDIGDAREDIGEPLAKVLDLCLRLATH